MNDEQLNNAFRKMWTSDLMEIVKHIENDERPASLSGIITRDSVENHRRVGMIRLVIKERASSDLTPTA